jgi:hypothetical protein
VTLHTFIYVLKLLKTRIWDYTVVAAYCALTMSTGCTTNTEDPKDANGGVEGDASSIDSSTGGVATKGGGGVGGGIKSANGGCGGMYGPQPCTDDKFCRDRHDGGNWYCDKNYKTTGACSRTVATCVPGIGQDAGNIKDAE